METNFFYFVMLQYNLMWARYSKCKVLKVNWFFKRKTGKTILGKMAYFYYALPHALFGWYFCVFFFV